MTGSVARPHPERVRPDETSPRTVPPAVRNALQAAGEGFKLVDPDGLVAEAEYDLGVLMREDPLELLHGDPRDRARWLAARCGLDATAIWEWGAAERVATGLVLTRIELQPVGRQMLATADHVAS
jgi:streptomycin 6-kinase